MTNYATQQQNDDMVSLLASQFRLLYNPTHAFADAVGMLQMFPGLVAAWPGSGAGSSAANNNALGEIRGRFPLSNNNTTLFNVENFISYVDFNGVTQYFNHSDQVALRVTGTETHIASGLRGLTLGGWFRFDNIASAAEALIYKLDNTNNSYYLQRRSAGSIQFGIYNTDAATAVNSLVTIGAGVWRFVVGRFTPSTEMKVWINGDTGINSTSIPASIDADTSIFTIGASGAPGNYFSGNASLMFLCQAAIPDIFINTFYQMTAPLFNVSI